MIKEAVAYRIGSFVLSASITWLLLEAMRPTSLNTPVISLTTSLVLLVTHTGYYIAFQKLWRHFNERL